jgi:hypothetical protein
MGTSEEHSSVVVSAKELRERRGRINYDLVRNTNEADIERQKIEDNHPRPEDLDPARVCAPAERRR